MLAAPKRLGSIRVPRVVFGVSPNRVFRRDAGNCTRGRVRSPVLPRNGGSQCAAAWSPVLGAWESFRK
jgi:hypothetical protein